MSRIWRNLFATCLLLAATAPVWAVTPAVAPAADPAAAFDRLLQQIENGEREASGPEASRDLAQLRQWLPAGDGLRARRYQTLHCEHLVRLDPDAALAYARQALMESTRAGAGDVPAQIRMRYCLGVSRGTVSTPQDALPDFNAAIELARAGGHDRLLAMGLAQRGSVRSFLGEQALALVDFLEAGDGYQRTGATSLAESNLLDIATVYRRMGEDAKAIDYLDQSIATARRTRDWSMLHRALLQTGFLHETAGRAEQTRAAFAQALQVAQDHTGLRQDAGHARVGLAASLTALDKPDEGLAMLKLAAADFAASGDASNDDFMQLAYGNAYAALGQHARALGHYEQAQRAFERNGTDRYLQMLYQSRAQTHEAMGNSDAALVDYKRYMATRETLDRKRHDEQTAVLRQQFDASRRDLENQRLRSERQAQQQRLATLLKTRRWQWTALALGGVLLVLLAILATRQLIRMRRLRLLASTDSLTGVANRRRIEHYGATVIAQALANPRPVSVLTFDIDHFKRINDGFGHAAGDEVLTRVALACQDALREFDLLGRTGGEEFLVVLPNTPIDRAESIAERLRTRVAELDLGDIAEGLTVTISLGIAEFRPDDANLTELMRRADVALYRAKGAGRNRAEVGH